MRFSSAWFALFLTLGLAALPPAVRAETGTPPAQQHIAELKAEEKQLLIFIRAWEEIAPKVFYFVGKYSPTSFPFGQPQAPTEEQLAPLVRIVHEAGATPDAAKDIALAITEGGEPAIALAILVCNAWAAVKVLAQTKDPKNEASYVHLLSNIMVPHPAAKLNYAALLVRLNAPGLIPFAVAQIQALSRLQPPAAASAATKAAQDYTASRIAAIKARIETLPK